MALITAAEAKELIPGITGTSLDTSLDTSIAQAEALIADWCGYPAATPGAAKTMEDTSYTRYYEGAGGRDLVLDVWPVLSSPTPTVEDDTTLDHDGSTYLVASSDYSVVKGTTLRLTSTSTHGTWSKGVEDAIKVTFTAGYATAPDNLKRAIAELVKHLRQGHRTQGAVSTSGKGGSRTRRKESHAIPAPIRAKLGGYRLPRAIL